MTEENNDSKEETRKAKLAASRYRQTASSNRQRMKENAKKQIKKKVKKKAKKAVSKTIINVLAATAPIWGIVLICLFAFLMLTYYVCEGGGFIAWVLRRTPLGNLCSM
jgi:Flp pilus assembly protein TadB